jgi:hypothetical protein
MVSESGVDAALALRAGARLHAATAARGTSLVSLAKRRWLDAATVKRGKLTTGARYWVTYCVHVLGVSPIMPLDASGALRRLYESWLEDMAVWCVECRPCGNYISTRSAEAYVSEARGWYHREYMGTLGVGAGNARIKALLRGGGRVHPQRPKRERLGVAPQDMVAGLAEVFPDPHLAGLRWTAALHFGMAALARGCEFALDDSRKEVFSVLDHMVPADVRFFYEDGVRHARLRMRKRKDLEVLTGKHHEVVLAGGGSVFDPVASLDEWLRARSAAGIPAARALFCHPDGRPPTVTEVRDMVRCVMRAAGRDPSLYGAHSLRIGGASAALAAGVPPALIRLLGRWSSDVYEIYCRMSLQSALQVGRAVGSTRVDSLEGGFHEEHFELQPDEIDFVGRGAGGDTFAEEDDG